MQTFLLTPDHPILPFDFQIGKIVKYAGLNSDQLDLILGKNLASLLRIEAKPSRLENHGRALAHALER
jgi:hypothetical protein